jgi:hypothetical protein
MKRLFSVIALMLLSRSAAPQNVGNDPEHTVSRMLSCGCLEGHDDKVLDGLGDASAVILTKVLAGRQPSTSEIDTALLILRMSFGNPKAVQVPYDREPRTTLFVLWSFESYARDSASRKQVEDTRQYILDQSASSSSNPPGD